MEWLEVSPVVIEPQGYFFGRIAVLLDQAGIPPPHWGTQSWASKAWILVHYSSAARTKELLMKHGFLRRPGRTAQAFTLLAAFDEERHARATAVLAAAGVEFLQDATLSLCIYTTAESREDAKEVLRIAGLSAPPPPHSR
jgi:hypothetical protein